MHPTLTIPLVDVTLPSYGVSFVLAGLAAVALMTWLASTDGFRPRDVMRIGVVAALAALFGARALDVLTTGSSTDLVWLTTDVNVGRTGGMFFGGLAGAVAASALGARLAGLPWWRVADTAAPALALGQAVGRCGCFLAGCCWGRMTSLPWGVRYGVAGTIATGVPAGDALHPVQLYEAVALVLVLAALLWYRSRRAFDGAVLALYLLAAGAVRVAVEPLRGDDRGDLAGLAAYGISPSTVIGLGLVVTGGAWLVWRATRLTSDASPWRRRA